MSALGGPVIAAALGYLGAPYVWKGKGWFLWSPTRFVPHAFGSPVFDCSGLVTVALREAGGPDLTGTHNAQAMFDQFPVASDPAARGVLRFYGQRVMGSKPTTVPHVTHVAICMGPVGGKVEVLEAAGGDSRTTSPKPGACVRVGPELRRDYLGSRVLP